METFAYRRFLCGAFNHIVPVTHGHNTVEATVGTNRIVAPHAKLDHGEKINMIEEFNHILNERIQW